MMRLVKNIIKRLFAAAGLVIFKRSTGIFLADDDTPFLALDLCASAAPVVVDGGSHKGAFVDDVLNLSRRSRFLCFEPDPSLAQELRQKFSDNRQVQIVEAALGSGGGRSKFHVNRDRSCNSIMSSGGGVSGLLGDLLTTVETIEVEVTSLDEAMVRSGLPACDILKLDLQGNELEALRGGGKTLRTASVVVVEVWYAPVYAATVTYLEICDLMKERGFSLYCLAGLHYSTTNRLLWSDAIFLRSDSPRFQTSMTIT